MSIVSEIQRINTNIANSYTAVDNKNGTLPQVQNSANLASAIDSIQSSNIIGATAEGESLSLTNTKAMPYSDYIVEGKSEQDGEPSSDYPSEIHSVADDVNLFDIESISSGNGDVSYEINNNHLIMTATGTTGAQYIKNFVKNVDSSKSYTLSFKTKKIVKETDKGSKVSILVYGSNDDSTYTALVNIAEDNPVEGQEYSKSSTVSGYKYYRFYIYNNTTTPVTVGEKTEYWDIKLQEGTTFSPYSPYNQGTVTIKQRGKNWFDYAKASDTNNTYITQYRIFEIDNLKPNTHYNINNMGFTAKLDNQYCYLWDTDTYSTSNKYLLAYVNQYNTKASFISNNEGKIYLAIYPTDTTTWESVISYLENAQIEERKQFNPLRTISNTTRLHYTNRTIKKFT